MKNLPHTSKRNKPQEPEVGGEGGEVELQQPALRLPGLPHHRQQPRTLGQVGGEERGRELVVLEVQTDASRSEGDEQKVGDCQSETRTPPPIPVNVVFGHFAKCTAVKSPPVSENVQLMLILWPLS